MCILDNIDKKHKSIFFCYLDKKYLFIKYVHLLKDNYIGNQTTCQTKKMWRKTPDTWINIKYQFHVCTKLENTFKIFNKISIAHFRSLHERLALFSCFWSFNGLWGRQIKLSDGSFLGALQVQNSWHKWKLFNKMARCFISSVSIFFTKFWIKQLNETHCFRW